MNKKTVKIVAIIIVLAMIITSFSFIVFLPSAYAETKDEDTNSREYLLNRLVAMQEYLEFINKYYKDDVNYDDLMDSAMEGATKSLNDPFSEFYLSDSDSEAFVDSVSGDYAGIGVTMQETDGKHEVVFVNPKGPALKAGIETGDLVVKIDGKDVSALSLEEAVALMRGEEGTKVTLTVDRNGTQKDIDITRAIVNMPNISYKVLEDQIGYMHIASFDADIAKEFKLAKIELVNKGAESLIIDMRNNHGGYMDEAIEIADQLIPEGYITHYINKGEIIESKEATGTVDVQMPIVVLVNEESASATELLAGALQDNKVATLVGTTTYGKGIAQQVISLSSGDKAKVSVFYFVTPNKHDIDHVGITPDYVVKNGYVGSEEAKAKYDAFAPMNENTKPALGDTDLNIYGAQQRLALLGYYNGNITGTMDDATAEALKKFQKDQGLYAYAVLDNTTRLKLEIEAYGFAYGNSQGEEDKQLEKAIEILKK